MAELDVNNLSPNEIMNLSPEDADKAFNTLLQVDNQSIDDTIHNTPDNTPNIDENQPDNNNDTTIPNIDKQDEISNNSTNVNSDDSQSDTAVDDSQSNTDKTNVQPKKEQQKFAIKANGQNYEFTQEELIKLAPKALNYTKKMQKLVPFRRSISAMQENNITEDDINQLIEMKKGNKTAIANFLEKSNIDAYDVSSIDSQEAQKYSPLKYGREQNELNSVIEDLELHPQSEKLRTYLVGLDDASRAMLCNKPDGLRLLMSDIENGYFDSIAAEANKRAFLEGNLKPMFDYYVDVATEQWKASVEAENKAKQQQYNQQIDGVRQQTKLTGNKASSNVPTPKKEIKSVADISDEELRKFEQDIGFVW